MTAAANASERTSTIKNELQQQYIIRTGDRDVQKFCCSCHSVSPPHLIRAHSPMTNSPTSRVKHSSSDLQTTSCQQAPFNFNYGTSTTDL